MEHFLQVLHKILFTGLTFLFFSDATVLLIRSKCNKARKTLGVIFLLWGLIYLLSLVSLYSQTPPLVDALYRVYVLISGNLFITLMVFFPVQALVPGWLNWKRGIRLFLPLLLIIATYFLGMLLLNEAPIQIHSYDELWATIGQFNVWFRFVILLSNVGYMYLIMHWLYRQENKYIRWKNDNFSDQEYVDISWMRAHNYLMVAIFLCYLSVLMFGGIYTILLHSLVTMIAFSYIFYKGLLYESPYPEDFFCEKNKVCSITNATEEDKLYEEEDLSANNPEMSFENKLPTYIDLLKNWMNSEKPYLYKDFKLTDVTRVLPLNRSYLSRVFNEGFGHNFCEVVRSYRVEYSKAVMEKNPSFPLYKVAALSGFNSDSTFVRAFKQVTGITPSQFKIKKSL